MKARLLIIVLTVILSACSMKPLDQPTPSPTNTPTKLPTKTAIPTSIVTPTEIPPTEPPLTSYSSKIRPILLSRCAVCHGGSRGTEEGLSLITYKNLLAGSNNGPVIVPGDAEASLLVELVTNQEMPKRGPKLTPTQVQLIVDWINQGALDN